MKIRYVGAMQHVKVALNAGQVRINSGDVIDVSDKEAKSLKSTGMYEDVLEDSQEAAAQSPADEPSVPYAKEFKKTRKRRA